MTVYDFPQAWYPLIVTLQYRVRSMSQVAARPWIGGRSVSGPHAQPWLADMTIVAERDPLRQDVDAFFTRLRGQSGLLRISDPTRLAPWYDRNINPTVQAWSDGALFTDGTGFASGFLPPDVYVDTAASRGANYIVLGGFPSSTASVIRRGDLMQVKPDGVAGTCPHLYAAMAGCDSDASGRAGIEISPRLRAGVAAGDQVSLRYAATIFRMTDDTQFEMNTDNGGAGNLGGSLVEALDLVP